MSPEPTLEQVNHLSDDALDDLLIDAGSSSDAAHLGSCEVCTARLATFRVSLGHFNQASAAWSQAKSNSISRELAPRLSRFRVLPRWSVAAAFFLAVALSFLVDIHRGMTPRNSISAASAGNEGAQGVDRQEEIAGDNAMLDAIDTAISQPVPSPVEVYGIEKTTSSPTPRTDPHEARD